MGLQEEVICFVANYVGEEPSKITPETLINEDLGVDGDDGRELLLLFSEEFNVDIDQIDDVYFGPEGISLYIFVYPILKLLNFMGFRWKKNIEIKSLPVSLLIESAEKKVWVHN